MQVVGVSNLRAHLGEFLRDVEQGDEIIITARGAEIARIVPPKKPSSKCAPGLKVITENSHSG